MFAMFAKAACVNMGPKHIKLLYHTHVLHSLLLQNSQDGQPSPGEIIH